MRWIVEFQNEKAAASLTMRIKDEKTMDGAIDAAHVLFSSLVRYEGIENWKLIRVEKV